MNYNAQRIKEQYNPDGGDTAVGANGQFIPVTWAEYALLGMVEILEARIEVLENNQRQVSVVQEAETMQDVVGLKLDSIG